MAKPIDEEATRWAILRDARALTDTEQHGLDAWLALGDRHVAALFRAEAILTYVSGPALPSRAQEPEPVTALPVAALAVGALAISAPPTRANPVRTPARRSILVRGAMAAAAVLAAVVALPLIEFRDGFSTEVGEVRKIPLPDGSTAMVNTASRITVAMQEKHRDVALLRGEAWFEVAHDTQRPFVVEAGDIRVRAVGTAFSVRRQSGGVDILVTDGVVEVWRDGDPRSAIRLKQGQRSFVPAESAELSVVTAQPEIERALAWRSGELALNGEPLSYAVDELNRYNHQKILIVDPVIGRTPIVGYFKTNDPANFAQAVTVIAGARVERSDDIIRLLPSK